MNWRGGNYQPPAILPGENKEDLSGYGGEWIPPSLTMTADEAEHFITNTKLEDHSYLIARGLRADIAASQGQGRGAKIVLSGQFATAVLRHAIAADYPITLDEGSGRTLVESYRNAQPVDDNYLYSHAS